MASIGNTSSNEPRRKWGRPRRVLFEELRAPETPNIFENTIPQHEPRAQEPPARNEPREQPPPRNEPMAEQLFTLLRQVLNQGQQQNNQEHRQEGDPDDKMLTRFLRFNPPRFKGEPDDQKVEFWLNEVEENFQVLNYTDLRMLRFYLRKLHDIGGR